MADPYAVELVTSKDKIREGRKRILTSLAKMGAKNRAVSLTDLQTQYFIDHNLFLNREELRRFFNKTRISEVFDKFMPKDVQVTTDIRRPGSQWFRLLRPWNWNEDTPAQRRFQQQALPHPSAFEAVQHSEEKRNDTIPVLNATLDDAKLPVGRPPLQVVSSSSADDDEDNADNDSDIYEVPIKNGDEEEEEEVTDLSTSNKRKCTTQTVGRVQEAEEETIAKKRKYENNNANEHEIQLPDLIRCQFIVVIPLLIKMKITVKASELHAELHSAELLQYRQWFNAPTDLVQFVKANCAPWMPFECYELANNDHIFIWKTKQGMGQADSFDHLLQTIGNTLDKVSNKTTDHHVLNNGQQGVLLEPAQQNNGQQQRFTCFGDFVEGALRDLHAQCPELARQLMQTMYAGIADYQMRSTQPIATTTTYGHLPLPS